MRLGRRKRRSVWKELFLLPLLALAAAAVSFVLDPPPPPPPPTPPGQAAGEALSGLQPVGVAQALELHRSGVLFLDARAEADYTAGHISGARLLSREPLDGDDAPVVIYGQGPDLEAVLAAAEAFVKDRSSPVYVLLEGLEGWLAAGNET
jgi:rhodanese-related sulfurtransferase